MKFYLVVLTLTISGLCLSGCATKYQKGNLLQGGYHERQISSNNFEISFSNGLFTADGHPAKQDKIVMKRAAEITLKYGYTHFTYRVNLLNNSIQITCCTENEAFYNAFNAQEVLNYIQSS